MADSDNDPHGWVWRSIPKDDTWQIGRRILYLLGSADGLSDGTGVSPHI